MRKANAHKVPPQTDANALQQELLVSAVVTYRDSEVALTDKANAHDVQPHVDIETLQRELREKCNIVEDRKGEFASLKIQLLAMAENLDREVAYLQLPKTNVRPCSSSRSRRTLR